MGCGHDLQLEISNHFYHVAAQSSGVETGALQQHWTLQSNTILYPCSAVQYSELLWMVPASSCFAMGQALTKDWACQAPTPLLHKTACCFDAVQCCVAQYIAPSRALLSSHERISIQPRPLRCQLYTVQCKSLSAFRIVQGLGKPRRIHAQGLQSFGCPAKLTKVVLMQVCGMQTRGTTAQIIEQDNEVTRDKGQQSGSNRL